MSEMTPEQKQYQKMTETPVPGLVAKLAVPTIISMLTTAIYNMADTFFVSQLGTSAAGAVGIVFSLMALIQAVGFMLGMGSGANISRLLGQQEKKEADRVGSTAFFTALAFGLILTAGGLAWGEGLMKALGSTDTILPYAQSYAQYILFGAPIMCASFVLNNILRSQGRATLSMIGIATGGVLNIALDPICIFVFGWGIAGAAIATLFSQCVSFCIMLFFFLSGRSTVRLSIRSVSRDPRTYWLIIKTGLPSLFRQGLASIATVALNVSAAVYGDAAVAAMSIVGRIMMLIGSAMIGFGQGYMPVVGFNYGAKKYDRVRQAFRFALVVGSIVLAVLGGIGFLLAPQVMTWFRADDRAVIEIGSFAMRCQCATLMFQPLTVLSNMTFQTVGLSWQATFVSSCRQGVFFLPFIFLLPAFFSLTGVQITQTAADLCTFVVCIPFLMSFFRKLKREEEGAAPAGAAQ